MSASSACAAINASALARSIAWSSSPPQRVSVTVSVPPPLSHAASGTQISASISKIDSAFFINLPPK
jgi:hypothetical protein